MPRTQDVTRYTPRPKVIVSPARRMRFAHCSNCGILKESRLVCECGTETYIGLWDREMTGCLEVGFSDYGLGVFATKDIPAWTLIESCPAYLVSPDDFKGMKSTPLSMTPSKKDNTIFNHMLFPWVDETSRCMAAGNAMLYNHAWKPNALYWFRMDNATGRYFLDFFTLRDVAAGGEVCITYGDDVWFYPYQNPDKHVSEYTLGEEFEQLRHGLGNKPKK